MKQLESSLIKMEILKRDENNVISGNNCMAIVRSGHQIMNEWIYRCLGKYVITFKRLDVIVGSHYT